MRVSLPLVGLAASWATLGAIGGATAEEGRGDIVGSWRAISATREGADADDLRGHQLTFSEDRFVIRSAAGEVLYRGAFTIDPAKQPSAIDFWHDAEPHAGTTWLGIYRVEQGTLTICDNAADPNRPRPTEFTSTPGSGTVLISFERVVP